MKRIPESEAIAKMTDARRFSKVMASNRFRQADYRRMAQRAVNLGLPPGAKVLDMGTGPGFVAIEVARLLGESNCQVVGMDLSGAMLILAAENAAKAGLNGSLAWREGDVKAMPFDDGEFDLVVSNDLLHHWDDPLPVFDEVARVLKEDGQYLIHDSEAFAALLAVAVRQADQPDNPARFSCPLVELDQIILHGRRVTSYPGALAADGLADRRELYGFDNCKGG